MEENEDERFLRRSEALGAEVIRLILGDPGVGVSMGPGTPKKTAATSNAETPSSAATASAGEADDTSLGEPTSGTEGSTRPSRSLGKLMQPFSDEIARNPDLLPAVANFVKPCLERVSIYSVTHTMFSGLCDDVLRQIESTNGWVQVLAVYDVVAELTRNLRRDEQGPAARERTFLNFAGQYFLSVGLSTALNGVFDQAEQERLQDVPSIPAVDIPPDDNNQ